MKKPKTLKQAIQEKFKSKSITTISKELQISRVNLSKILNGHRELSSEMAIKLSKLTNTTIEYWLVLNARNVAYKLTQEEQDD